MDVFSYQCENHIKKSSPHSIANIEGFHYFHPQKMKLGFLIKPFFLHGNSKYLDLEIFFT